MATHLCRARIFWCLRRPVGVQDGGAVGVEVAGWGHDDRRARLKAEDFVVRLAVGTGESEVMIKGFQIHLTLVTK